MSYRNKVKHRFLGVILYVNTNPVRNRWTDTQKKEILAYAEINGVMAAGREFNVSRVSIANWRKPERYLERKERAKSNPEYKERNRKRAIELHYLNPERANKKSERYRKKRRFKMLVLMSNRYFPKNEKLTTWDLWKIAKKQRMICALTGVKLTGENISVDHIVAKSKGGSNKPENIRLVHKDANLAKRALSDSEFLDLCRKVIAWHEKPAPCEGGPFGASN